MDTQNALLCNTNITSTIPLQVGMREDHMTLSRHVIEALPSSWNPGLHSYDTTDPMMNSSPVLVPFGKCPGSPQLPSRNRKRKCIGNRQVSNMIVGHIYMLHSVSSPGHYRVSKTLYEVHWSKTRYLVSNIPMYCPKSTGLPIMKSKDPTLSNTKLRLQLKQPSSNNRATRIKS